VAICARKPQELERARAHLSHLGEVRAVACDVTQRGQVEDMVALVEEELGPIDVLVNNAGIVQAGPHEHMTLDDYESAMAVHFWAMLHTTRAVLPGMRERGGGHIINLTSIGGRVSVPHMLPYCASKYAAVGYSRGLHAELAPQGIRVTTVCPLTMRTGSPRQGVFTGQPEAEFTWFLLTDSLPGLSMSARVAARRIVTAAARNKAEVMISLPAWAAATVVNLAPNLAARLLGLVAGFMPKPPPGPPVHRKGSELEHRLPPLVQKLAVLTRRAERRNNEVPRRAPAATPEPLH
jgi:short-subunit dehydrogenase